MLMLEKIRIVLIHTSHPGNIGSAARAMKTMGLSALYLVSPKEFPHPKANEMASGAVDILEKAVVVDRLEDAIGDCGLVVGTSARARSIPWPLLTPRELGEKATQESVHHPVAILFGREQSGLTNEELHRCHFHVHIPSHPEYSSLNLAAAVQVIAYELYSAAENNTIDRTWDCRLATEKEVEDFYGHLEKVLKEIDFLKPTASRQLMTRLRRLFNRTRLDEMEVNILRGFLTAVGRFGK